MDTAIQSAAPKKERITSIDALRAFTLLGILIVHSVARFGLYDPPQSVLDSIILKLNELFLENKCNTIFAALFGISFYLILRNPNNSSIKFVWRCFLLMIIGLFNKLFFTYDVLMLYGFWGMVLVIFRNLKPKWLIFSCICILIVRPYLAEFNLGDKLFGTSVGIRYSNDKSFYEVLSYYPNAVLDYLHVMLNVAAIGFLASFLFGYWIAKIGFIEHLKERLSKRYLFLIWVIYFVLFVINYLQYKFDSQFVLMKTLTNYSGSVAYASALLYLYYHSESCKKVFSFFEPYGRLGLTNYSMSGILGVIFINEFGLGLYKYPLMVIILFFIVFFLFQAVFSYYWLRYFTYGPMEYVWRVATERKKIPFRRHQKD